MAKKNGTSSSKEEKSRKRKLAAVLVETRKEEDPSVYDADDQETPPANSPAVRSSKRQRQDTELDTSKPSAVFEPTKGRDWTLSIALPGSFIANTLKPDQKNDLVGRIGRAAAVFCVDEIVIFDDAPDTIPQKLRAGKDDDRTKAEVLAGVPDDAEPWDNPDQFLYHVLTYMECPAHLKKRLFSEHPNLRGAGRLPPLDTPHHMKSDEWCQYREGVTLSSASAKPQNMSKKKPSRSSAPLEDVVTLVDCGLRHPVKLRFEIPPNTRVTLRFANVEPPPNWPNLSAEDVANLDVEPTTPNEPREEGGYYWGFTVRKAASLSEVYMDSPFQPDGYDVSIGTSERGVPLSSILPNSPATSRSRRPSSAEPPKKLPSSFQHLLLVFGGVAGLEPAVESDPVLKDKGLTKETASEVFDYWVNLLPGQGSRTIRTEEAVLLGLMGLSEYVQSNVAAD